MIRKVTVTNYLDESLTIDLFEEDPDHGFLIKSIEGLGPPKANINTTELATADGSLYNSARLDERNIVIKMEFQNAPDIETVRQRTYKYFPIKKRLTLIIEADHRILSATGYVEKNEPDIFSKREGNVISIICDDPYLYSAGLTGTNETTFYGVDPEFEFEFENEVGESELEFGSIESDMEKNIYYSGDSEVGITIVIHALGECGSIVIYNTGTRERMRIDSDRIKEMTGHGIMNGDDIIITTMRGNKKATLLRGGYYRNILNALDRDSDWFTLTKGDNIFAYVAELLPEKLEFRITNRIIYEGV